MKKVHDFLGAMGRSPDSLCSFFGTAQVPEHRPWLMAATPDKLNAHLDKAPVQNFLACLRWVVIDEAHFYKGCFGINVALFLRRLLSFAPRDCRLVLASATLDNTVTFARALTGRREFCVVAGSSAPQHARYYYLARPLVSVPLKQVVADAEESRTKGLIFVLLLYLLDPWPQVVIGHSWPFADIRASQAARSAQFCRVWTISRS